MNPLNDEQLSQIKHMLLTDKRALEKHFELNEQYGLNESLADQTGELSAYDNHPADLGSEMFERSKDIALNVNAKHELEQVLQALQSIEDGTYGTCIICHEPILFERLEAIPTTQYCKSHVPDTNVSNYRPVEEEFLNPPFGRTSFDNNDSETEFDGEDAWQIVESWGTSNTPAMQESNQIDNYNEMYIEADEHEGYVEAIESFLATDIYGSHVTVVRNKEYRNYMEHGEGDPLLEPDIHVDEEHPFA
jgi:YteA family regulatory protein